jgi:Tfp pilus assembly protein PilF
MTGNTRREAATTRRIACALATLLLLVLATGARAGSLEKAQAAAKSKDWAQAAELYASVLDGKPNQRDACIGLAEAAVRAGRTDLYGMAEEGLLTLVDKSPKDLDVRVALGNLSIASSAAKTDTLAKNSYDAQAQEQFKAALEIDPTSDAAAAGMAHTLYNAGDFAGAVASVDAFLAKKPKAPAGALYWKGQAYYLQARDAFTRAGNKMSSDVREQFRKAQGAYRASTMAKADGYDAWLQLGYASAYLGDTDEAQGAYVHAAELDPTQTAPMEGLKSLLKYKQDAYQATLAKILQKNPKHEMARWYVAIDRYAAKDWAGAKKAFQAYIDVARAPAEGWYWMGFCAHKMGDDLEAENDWYKTLELAPNHVQATLGIEQLINKGTEARDRAASSLKGAQQVIREYAPLLKASPKISWIRNNLGLTLRDAYVKNGKREAWVPILKEATKVYVEASDIIGEWTAEKERTYKWAQRWGEARTISDTGLMFQFYAPTRDYAKAERYYRRALEYTDDGFPDAFNNLSDILAKQKRWQELYDLAASCADRITTEQGQPDMQTRGRAREIMKKLVADGKAKKD